MAQNQKTEPSNLESDRKVLNDNEQSLIEAWAQGHDQVTCYRMAYGAEGYSKAALEVRACRKFAEQHIQAELRVLRATGLAKARLSLEERLKEEQAFAQRAEDAGNFGAAGGAHDRINKLAGHYVDKHQDVTAGSSPEQTVEQFIQQYPHLADAAKLVAKSVGVVDEGATKH